MISCWRLHLLMMSRWVREKNGRKEGKTGNLAVVNWRDGDP